MKDAERARAMCALAAVEINLSELHGIEGWWDSLSGENRHRLLEFQGEVRAYQHELQNPPTRLHKAIHESFGREEQGPG